MKAGRWTMWILVTVFFGGLLSNVGFELSYAGNQPRTPDAATGKVIRLTVNHGTEIYVDERDLQLYTLVKNITMVVMLVSFAGAGLLKVFGSKAEDARKKSST